MACLRKCPQPNGTCMPVLTHRSSPTYRTLPGPEPTGRLQTPRRGGDLEREPGPTVTLPECCNAELLLCQSAGELNIGLGCPGPPPSSSCLLDLPFKRFSTCQFMFTSAHRTALGNVPCLEMMLITHFGLPTSTIIGFASRVFYLPIYGTSVFAHATRLSPTAFPAGQKLLW